MWNLKALREHLVVSSFGCDEVCDKFKCSEMWTACYETHRFHKHVNHVLPVA